MVSTKPTIGRGTKVRVAPIGRERIFPEATVFSTTGAAKNATSLPVTFEPALNRAIPASPENPLFLNFTEASGRQHLIKVTASIAPDATNLTVAALKNAVGSGAISPFPVILSKRTSANLTDQDAQADVMTFENDGWKDSVTTMLGNGLELPGYYDALDAGWNTCYFARLNFGEIYWELELKAPEGYQKGHIIKGFGGIQMPLEVPSDNIINANITISSRGPVTFIDPA